MMENFTSNHSNEQLANEQRANDQRAIDQRESGQHASAHRDPAFDQRNPSSRQPAFDQDMSHIKGWAVDANPKNDPTYPMRNREYEETKKYDWDRPSQQSTTTEVLHSNERDNLTAVYGTSTPPTGLSGAIRRFAFRYSESRFAHWLPLLLADRVNMIEGLISDVSSGRLPNVLAEKGIKAQWKHNPKAVVKQAAIGVALAGSVYFFLKRRKKAKLMQRSN